MQERPRRRHDPDFVVDAMNLKPIQRLDGGARLTLRRAEAGEIMMADQARCRLRHGIGIQRNWHVPYLAHIERRGRSSVQNSVEVTPSDRRKPRVKIVIDQFDVEDGYRPRSDEEIRRAAYFMCRVGSRQIDMRYLSGRMNPRIRPPGALDKHIHAGKIGEGFFQDRLHRRAIRLALPTDKTGAVILDGQFVSGHDRIVPAGIVAPRRKALRSIA